MKKQVLFIQGGGDDGYHADQALVDSLRKVLGKEYTISYPELSSDDSLPDFGWPKQIEEKITGYKDDFVLVAHSFGASMVLKYISENKTPKHITGIFLLATPFWDGKEDWQTGFMLQPDFADRLPENIPMYFYHCKDDEEVPFVQFERYKQQIKQATFHESKTGGHQFDHDLRKVGNDIKSL